MSKHVPVYWYRFQKGSPVKCNAIDYGVCFPRCSEYGLSVHINTKYPKKTQDWVLLSELYHLIEFRYNIDGYTHANMHKVFKYLYVLIQDNPWLRKYLWK